MLIVAKCLAVSGPLLAGWVGYRYSKEIQHRRKLESDMKALMAAWEQSRKAIHHLEEDLEEEKRENGFLQWRITAFKGTTK